MESGEPLIATEREISVHRGEKQMTLQNMMGYHSQNDICFIFIMSGEWKMDKRARD